MRLKHTSWLVVGLMLASLVPVVSQAAALDLYNPNKKYGDEKTDINNPTSRCTGADFKKMYQDGLVTAKKDFDTARGGGEASPALTAAFETYKKDIDYGWEAMEEPYCGFGAFGASAAKKSFQKTLTRARAAFLAEAKKQPQPVVALKAVPTPVVAVPEAEASAKVSTPPASKPASEEAVKKASSRVMIKSSLKRGMRGDQVKALQDWLVENDYLEKDYATGYFGTMTEAAVIKFQLKKKLITSKVSAGAGLVGPKTRAQLVQE